MKIMNMDLSGKKFNRLTAICRDGETGSGVPKWKCKCDCGNIVSINVYSLYSGRTKSCGCYSRELTAVRNLQNVENIMGKRFGRLVVLEYVGVINGRGSWKCKCDCGAIKTIAKHDLDTGRVLSCGCYHDECIIERSTKHNGTKERLYRVWAGMKERCYNPNTNAYQYYGGRGISVCDEWRDNYVAFRDWALANGYNELSTNRDCTLDRIDVNKGYCPENCRWVDMITQANNRRDNLMIEYKGISHTMSEWARILSIKPMTLYRRIVIKEWPVEKAFTTST